MPKTDEPSPLVFEGNFKNFLGVVPSMSRFKQFIILGISLQSILSLFFMADIVDKWNRKMLYDDMGSMIFNICDIILLCFAVKYLSLKRAVLFALILSLSYNALFCLYGVNWNHSINPFIIFFYFGGSIVLFIMYVIVIIILWLLKKALGKVFSKK